MNNKERITNSRLLDLVSNFKISGNLASLIPYGSGHINDTYHLINSDQNENDYLLQRINHHVFKNVRGLMNNITYVTDHLKNKISAINGGDPDRQVLTMIQTKNGNYFVTDENGNYWRLYYFLKGTKSYDRVETDMQAMEGGKAFGRFQSMLSDIDTSLIIETIPHFHDIVRRLENLQVAINNDISGRLRLIQSELEFILARKEKMEEIQRLGKAGILPLRIIHNDAKFNNVLLDENDKAQCVIDLDTVMPGYVAYDFGDATRTIINTAAEDEENMSKIDLNIPLFEAYTKGYLKETVRFLIREEVDSLIKGMLLLPYMQAVRFLTDYLEGDHYFKIHSPEHNLHRTKAQLQLVLKLEEQEQKFHLYIKSTWEKYKQEFN
jgi:Ser/Thr protein kinase RdoA (MazF antagonist)